MELDTRDTSSHVSVARGSERWESLSVSLVRKQTAGRSMDTRGSLFCILEEGYSARARGRRSRGDAITPSPSSFLPAQCHLGCPRATEGTAHACMRVYAPPPDAFARATRNGAAAWAASEDRLGLRDPFAYRSTSRKSTVFVAWTRGTSLRPKLVSKLASCDSAWRDRGQRVRHHCPSGIAKASPCSLKCRAQRRRIRLERCQRAAPSVGY